MCWRQITRKSFRSDEFSKIDDLLSDLDDDGDEVDDRHSNVSPSDRKV